MIAAACALATIEFAPSGCAAQKPARCSRLRPVSAAQNGRGVCEATSTHRVARVATWTPERVEQLRTCVVERSDVQPDRRRNRRHPQCHHRQDPSPRPQAAAVAGDAGADMPSPRGVPAFSPAQAAAADVCRSAIAGRRARERTRSGREHAALLAPELHQERENAAGRWPIRSAITAARILSFAGTRRLGASPTAPAMPAWLTACRRGSAPEGRCVPWR